MIRPTMVLIVLLAASLGVMLYVVKYQVQALETQLVALDREISDDRQAIHVLNAEWSHLNEPARVRHLAERYLGLQPIKASQVGTADEWFKADIPGISAKVPLTVSAPAVVREPLR